MDEYIEDGYTLVAGPLTMPSVGTSNQWVSMRFDRQFRYEGGDLDIIIHRTNVDNYQPASGATRTCDTYQTVNV